MRDTISTSSGKGRLSRAALKASLTHLLVQFIGRSRTPNKDLRDKFPLLVAPPPNFWTAEAPFPPTQGDMCSFLCVNQEGRDAILENENRFFKGGLNPFFKPLFELVLHHCDYINF